MYSGWIFVRSHEEAMPGTASWSTREHSSARPGAQWARVAVCAVSSEDGWVHVVTLAWLYSKSSGHILRIQVRQ